MKPQLDLKQIGERIKSRRTELSMTQPELAELVGLKAPSVSKYEKGKVPEASLAKLREFAKALEAPADWLIGGAVSDAHNDNGVKMVPVIGKTAAGIPIFAVDEYSEYAYVSEDESVDFAVRVQGDSMINARIYDGDMVFARSQPTVQNGEIAIVALDDGGETHVTTKRFYKYGPTIVLRSENPAYKDIEIPAPRNVRVIGKVIFLKGQVY